MALQQVYTTQLEEPRIHFCMGVELFIFTQQYHNQALLRQHTLRTSIKVTTELSGVILISTIKRHKYGNTVESQKPDRNRDQDCHLDIKPASFAINRYFLCIYTKEDIAVLRAAMYENSKSRPASPLCIQAVRIKTPLTIQMLFNTLKEESK